MSQTVVLSEDNRNVSHAPCVGASQRGRLVPKTLTC